MLRIKEDADLKELEKFGFSYKENKRLPLNSVWEWNNMLEIKGNSNEQIYIKALDTREITVISTCGVALNKLYDLIQAGLIEKFEEDR